MNLSLRRAAAAVLSAAAFAMPAAAFAQFAIVLNSRDASVSLIDQTTFKEVGRVDVGKEPHHLYPMPDGKTLIVANAVSNDLHFLDPSSGKVLGRLRAGLPRHNNGTQGQTTHDPTPIPAKLPLIMYDADV